MVDASYRRSHSLHVKRIKHTCSLRHVVPSRAPFRLFFGAVGEGGGCSLYSFTHVVPFFWLLNMVEVYVIFGCDVGGDSHSV